MIASVALGLTLLLAAPPSSAAPPQPVAPAAADAARPAPLGVSYSAWKGQFADAAVRLARFKEVGFGVVSFVPNYAYEGLDRINVASGPDAVELAGAVEAGLRAGFIVVVKPHLDPPAYGPGFDRWRSENDSWRAHCPWRGFFDVDPMGAAYREGIVFASLRAIKGAFDNLGAGGTPLPAVRLEVGAELMNAVVYTPERWVRLLAAAKRERHRLGLDGRVLLSHNFTHHIEIVEDYVGRMNAAGKRALNRYIRGLDALALSQYMDLTATMPKGERGQRLPSVDEVAQALRLHEKNFRKDILEGALGLRPTEIPPLHIGEFGVGRGGLRHPNLWDGAATPAEEKQLTQEITRGHEGLLRYLAQADGRTARSAVLWVTGPHYDVFGWESPTYAIPAAAAAIRNGLRR